MLDAEDAERGLTEDDFTAAPDPFSLFEAWLAEAAACEPNDPNAVALASVAPDGMPNLRMVLLKGVDPEGAPGRGFVFYTNLESAKGEELRAHPKAALLFHWKTLRRQVRVRGVVSAVSEAEADAYFATRPRGSQIGAWASRQSRPLESRAVLEEAVAATERRFEGAPVPRPPHWSGFRVTPRSMEFWKDGAFRLHDRALFSITPEGGWSSVRLYP